MADGPVYMRLAEAHECNVSVYAELSCGTDGLLLERNDLLYSLLFFLLAAGDLLVTGLTG
jgi:hypothetical protein